MEYDKTNDDGVNSNGKGEDPPREKESPLKKAKDPAMENHENAHGQGVEDSVLEENGDNKGDAFDPPKVVSSPNHEPKVADPHSSEPKEADLTPVQESNDGGGKAGEEEKKQSSNSAKISSAASAIAEKASSAKNAVTSKLSPVCKMFTNVSTTVSKSNDGSGKAGEETKKQSIPAQQISSTGSGIADKAPSANKAEASKLSPACGKIDEAGTTPVSSAGIHTGDGESEGQKNGGMSAKAEIILEAQSKVEGEDGEEKRSVAVSVAVTKSEETTAWSSVAGEGGNVNGKGGADSGGEEKEPMEKVEGAGKTDKDA